MQRGERRKIRETRLQVSLSLHMAACCIALLFLFLLLLHCSGEARAQATAAPAPGPVGPPNVTAVLEKAGQFSILMRLLKSTQVGDQINTQLNNSNAGGLTLFAPTDNAFANLPTGTLNSLSDQQKVALVQFHVLPGFVPLSQFQTVSNPLRTQAGDASGGGGFPLNVTSSRNQVNITTGVVNTTVSNTLFSGGRLAVYQVDQVLLPLQIFGHVAPAPVAAPPPKPKKGAADSPAEGASGPSKDAVDASAATGLREMVALGGLAAAALLGFFF